MRWNLGLKKDRSPNKKKEKKKKRLPLLIDGEMEAPRMEVIHPRPQMMGEQGWGLNPCSPLPKSHIVNALQLFLDA